jgi:single-strand DNA-binding protein
MAKDLNRVTLTGHLGKEVETRTTQQGTLAANFTVANGRRVKDGDSWKEETEWFKVVAWDRLAENCSNLLHKGSHVYIEGRLQTREWLDKDGNKRYTTEVIASDMLILDSKRANHETENEEEQQINEPEPEEVTPVSTTSPASKKVAAVSAARPSQPTAVSTSPHSGTTTNRTVKRQ